MIDVLCWILVLVIGLIPAYVIASAMERRREQWGGCRCFCPKCEELLTECVSSDLGTSVVVYVCECGTWSEWDFGPPVPIMRKIVTPHREGEKK